MAVGGTRVCALAALLLLMIQFSVNPSAEAYDQGYHCSATNRCPGKTCYWEGLCGEGIYYCGAPNCDCSAGYCDPEAAYPPRPRKKCFPSHATVQLAGGKFKAMEELALGDMVTVWDAETGRIIYSEVHAFGHKDALAVSSFVKIGMAAADDELSGKSSRPATLELSPGHFVPTVKSGTKSLLYKRAQDVVVGDYLLVSNGNGDAATQIVTGKISSSLRQGAFNPFTTRGSIIVDGVVASVHSDWFLDPLFNFLGIPHFMPAVYQAVLTPARVLYVVLGKELYIAAYNALDLQLNLAELGTNHGGHLAATGLLAVLTGFLLRKRISRTCSKVNYIVDWMHRTDNKAVSRFTINNQ